MSKRIAIAGVTGAVGQEILSCLQHRNFPFSSIKMLASARSAGKTQDFHDVDIALFSAGGSQSKLYAPAAAASGSAALNAPKGIIANPNCSTIIMNLPVFPLHKAYGVERVSVATYQAASGAGAAAMYVYINFYSFFFFQFFFFFFFLYDIFYLTIFLIKFFFFFW
eukprot:GSMAST32.ASY1.ANO1.1007.1 assembled CDS